MASSLGIYATNGVKHGNAEHGIDELDTCAKKGSAPRYNVRDDQHCPAPHDGGRQADAFMIELLYVMKRSGVEYDENRCDNLALAMCAIAEAANPIACQPSDCPQEILAGKKLWFQTDTKKLMAKCEIKSQDCCEDFVFWQEMASIVNLNAPDEVFTGSSMETPPEESALWFQTDTAKLFKKISIDGVTNWVEVS